MKVIKREAVTEKIPLAWFFSVFSFIALPGLSWKAAPHCRQDGGSSRVKELISVESDCCSMLEKDGKKLRKSASSGVHKFSFIFAITTQGKAAIYDNDRCSHFELQLLT